MRWCLLFLILFAVNFFPQNKKSEMSEMRIIGMGEFHPEELIDYDVKDANGDVAAGLIIETDLVGLAYDANLGMVKMNHSPGRDFLFLQYKERELKIMLSGYAPLQVILKNYGIKLEKGKSWLLKLTADKKSELIPVTFLVQPAGAEIIVDGKSKGQVESCTLPIGEHELQVVKTGYETVVKKITVSLESAMYKFTLKEVQDEKVFIASKPMGAKIEIDRAAKGETDREVFVPSGIHKLSLIKADYLRLDTNLTVKAGGTNNFTFNLTRNIAVLNISVIPSDAEILIDNLAAHQGVNELLPGEHTFSISKTGYGSEERSITIKLGESSNQEFNLQRIDGTITLSVTPIDAQIKINGKAYQGGVMRVEPGSYDIAVTKLGYLPANEKIIIKLGDDINKEILLTKNAAFMNLTVNPPDAEILLNGRKISAQRTEVSPGKFSVEIIRDGYLSERDTFSLAIGQEKKKNYILEKNSGTINFTVTPSNASITISDKRYTEQSIDLAPGTYKALISAEGFRDKSESFTIERGKAKSIAVNLEEITGKLEVSLNIPEAQCELYKNGKLIEQWTGSKQFTKLQVGEYEIVIKAKGYKTSREKVSIVELEKTAKSIDLKAGMDVDENINSAEVSRIKHYEIKVEPSVGENMVFVEGGTYQMGGEYTIVDYIFFMFLWIPRDYKPIHNVTVNDFYIGKYEVTQKEWEAVMGSNPSNFKGANRPVEQVSWNDVQEYIRKLNTKTGKHYRLPTEAEWEYAAKGGNQSRGYEYSGSNGIDEVAWYDGNSSNQTHKVGQKQPNELGIYDMSGNVWERCSDWYGENYYKNSPSINPKGPDSGKYRVFRGGSWYYFESYCCSSYRGDYPDNNDGERGFRLVLDP